MVTGRGGSREKYGGGVVRQKKLTFLVVAFKIQAKTTTSTTPTLQKTPLV